MVLNYKIAEVGLRVTDLERASEFYQDVVGFRYHHREDGVIFLEIGSLDSALGAVGHPQLLALFDRGSDVDQGKSSFDHIAFEVPSDNYDAELVRYQKRNMVIRERAWPGSLLWNGRSFFFRDPDLNVVEIIAAND